MKKKNLLLTVFAILGFAFTTLAQVPSYVPTNGLESWYPFTGNANDASGNGHNGTVSNATLTTDRFGNTNSAYFFVGTSGSLIESFPNLPIGNSDRSVSSWFKTNNTSGSGGMNGNILWNWGNKVTNQMCEMNFFAGKLEFTSYATNSTSTTQIISDNIWHNIIFTYNGTLICLYLDGILIKQQTVSPIFNTANSSFYIGERHNEISQQKMDGSIDDIGLWNRALTQQEITALYSGCNLSFTTQPTNQSVNITNNAQFELVSADPLANFQWQTDLGLGFQNLSNAGQYSGVTNDTMLVSNTTMTNNNQVFRCVVTSGSCSDTSNVATLTVINNVGISELNNSEFKVYPNPATSQINVQANACLIGSSFTIKDQ